jgi:hypothetical protein
MVCSKFSCQTVQRTTLLWTMVLLSIPLYAGWLWQAKPGRSRDARKEPPNGGYVGSKVCTGCHRSIYDSFSRTDMGRSMSAVTPDVLGRVPDSAEVFDPAHNRHLSVSTKNGQLYQSEWETDEKGKEVFRETERVAWMIGAGANGMGALVQRGQQVTEAPLTYYTKTRAWALSPGYEDADRGFSRPIDASCIVCHSGRPNPVAKIAGTFRTPPFEELPIACENCHGPGGAHVVEMSAGAPAEAARSSIVNPGRLSAWLADNVCMSCHQSGDARILQPGKNFQDFRPGQPLDQTLALFMPPPEQDAPPRADVLQHYFSMTLSTCYRSSGEKLSCITCHDPHRQPARDQAPAYYRRKCLLCHTESSCTAPAAARRQTAPADNCVGCHMPKRNIVTISHASLTNHRIIATPDEPFPDVTFHLATPSLPDLVHLDAIPGRADSLSPVTLLQAYGQIGAEHREYLPRYFALGKQLETSHPDDIHVLEALAADALRQGTPHGDEVAANDLSRAIELGSTMPWDFEELGSRLLRQHKFQEAEACLRKGIERARYDQKLYALLAEDYFATRRSREASATLIQALQRFPQVDLLRAFLREVQEAGAAGRAGNRPQK